MISISGFSYDDRLSVNTVLVTHVEQASIEITSFLIGKERSVLFNFGNADPIKLNKLVL